MLKIRHADNSRGTLAGPALVSAPLALVVSEVVYGRFFSQEPDGEFFATSLGLLAAVLFVPAVVGMVHLVKDRGVVLAHVGGALTVIGAVGYACHQMLFVVTREMARMEGQREAVTAVSELLDGSVLIGVIVMPMFLVSFSGA